MDDKKLIIKQSGKYFHKRAWEDAELALYSGGRVQIQLKKSPASTIDKDINLPMFTKIGKPKYGDFAGVFVIHTEEETKQQTGPRFACENPQDSDRCVQLLNYETLKMKLARKHPHPLTRTSDPTSCVICATKEGDDMDDDPYEEEEELYWTCEFCADYGECAQCHARMTATPTMVKSPTHQHQLMRLESAEGTWLSQAYDGHYECDTCGTQSSSVVYHCVECGDFDECPQCALKDQGLSGDIATSPAQLILDVGHLSKVVTVNGLKYSLDFGPDSMCPVNMSMKATKCWDLSRIEHEPVPHAYMEVTFDHVEQDSVVGVGVANQIFEQNQLLGHQQNSFAAFNNGCASHNRRSNQISFFNMTFTSGDTIGVGILMDSFNYRAVYYTKNGQYIGAYKDHVHKGMDCFPGVTFIKTSKVQFAVNMTGPFKFDVNSLPNYRNTARDHISSVPHEILDVISSYAAQSMETANEYRTVCRRMSESFKSNAVWKNIALQLFPHQNSDLKLKSWYNYCKARKDKVQFYEIGIENCDFEFECPMAWDSLQSTDLASETERFCNKCQKTVYNVSDNETLAQYIAMGRCVTFIEEDKFNEKLPRRLMGKRAPPKMPKAFVDTAPY